MHDVIWFAIDIVALMISYEIGKYVGMKQAERILRK